MTDIDVATGLPVLPDGHYWRVAPHWRYGFEVVVAIFAHKTKVEVTRDWLGRRREAVTPIQVRVWGESVGSATERVTDSETGRERPRYLERHEVTSEDILRTAEHVLGQWATWRNAEGRIEALLGDYPPKTLIGTE